MATSSNVIVQYMYALRAKHDPSFSGVCSPTTDDLTAVVQFPKLDTNQKRALSKVDYTYNNFSKQLSSLLKTHLTTENSKYHGTISNDAKGTLHFKNPALYLGNNHNEAELIMADDSIKYEFFMMRSIAGAKALPIQDGFILSGSSAIKPSSKNIFVDAFDYKNAKGEIIMSYHPSGTANLDALEILKQDRIEVEKIIKNVYQENLVGCNTLKNVDSYNQLIVCTGISDTSHTDYFLEFMICLETFNLIQKSGFC